MPKLHEKVEDACREASNSKRRLVWSVCGGDGVRYVQAPSRLQAIAAAAEEYGIEVEQMTMKNVISAMSQPLLGGVEDE